MGTPVEYDHRAVEAEVRAIWEDHQVYRFDRATSGQVFSVDTPPPYTSADNLHVGHAMSYSQPDFLVRYHRMRGEQVFYPMGFDDNGLPTERYVEHSQGVRARDLPRAEFVALCLAETERVAAGYEELWRRLGLSVDWSLRYSTIAPDSRRAAQTSFRLLYEQGHITRSDDPILWCPECRTALAQADVEDRLRSGALHRIGFGPPSGAQLEVATTRPELLPACVALYCHPDDDRYRKLVGDTAAVPLSGHRVPIRADDEVDPGYGTGLMMVCTFGDSQDVLRWRRDRLPLRLAVTPEGRMGELAGEFAGTPLPAARNAVLARLAEHGVLRGTLQTRQTVGVHERCGTPVEFQLRPQWFLRVRRQADVLRQRAAELTWVPAHMRHRLLDWIDGLKWDWNLSRQRHYGTPFPAWFCRGCGTPVLAELAALPVDPLTDPPPVTACPDCGATELDPDQDVLDTWFTSSLTPQLNSGWAERGCALDPRLFPMSLRVQGHEIIRTWLFYTLVQSQLHHGRLPWQQVMISGWGLNEQGKKISKRELSRDGSSGYLRYRPEDVIDRYGADALRLWATKARVGTDLRFHERDVRAGRKLAVKLWNVGRFLDLRVGGGPPPRPVPAEALLPEDRQLLAQLTDTAAEATGHLDAYEVMAAYQSVSRFFWSVYCDRYLEQVKTRWTEDAPEQARDSARTALWQSFRTLLGLFAPFAPFVTEHLYQQRYRSHEGTVSLHLTAWPAPAAAAK